MEAGVPVRKGHEKHSSLPGGILQEVVPELELGLSMVKAEKKRRSVCQKKIQK